MSKILSRDHPNATAPGTGANLIPDPWELSTPAPELQVAKTWQVSSGVQPLNVKTTELSTQNFR